MHVALCTTMHAVSIEAVEHDSIILGIETVQKPVPRNYIPHELDFCLLFVFNFQKDHGRLAKNQATTVNVLGNTDEAFFDVITAVKRDLTLTQLVIKTDIIIHHLKRMKVRTSQLTDTIQMCLP